MRINFAIMPVRIVVIMLLLCAAVASAQRIEPLGVDRRTPAVRVFGAAKNAVVNISSTRVVKTRRGFFGFSDDPFDDIFMSPFARNVPVQSLGSGFVIHPDGYIVTNEHVVRRAMKITVFFADKTSLDASVIATDPTHDLAVLKVTPASDTSLAALSLGRSDDLMIGETVLAIGNPKGYRHSVTAGVISALDRELRFGRNVEYKGLIQTDASINPGNSGGPLLNVNAEVIGVNTAIRPDAQGIGFAIAVDDLIADLPNLLDYRRINRVIVGMDLARQAQRGADGLLVAAVDPGGPAAAAGVEAGQIITEIDGEAAASLADYHVCLLGKQPGQTVAVKIRSDDGDRQVEISLVGRPKPDGKALARKWLGVSIRPIGPALARRMRLATDKGLLVTAVASGSPADQIGVRVRDVLFQLGASYVGTLDEVGHVLEDVGPGQVLRVGITRGAMRAWTNIRTAEE